MTTLKSCFSTCLILAALFCVVACSQKQEQLNSTPFHSSSKSSTLSQKTLKPGAPVSLIAPRVIQINANQMAAIDLHLQVLQHGKLRIKFSTSDGLQLLTTAETQVLDINATEITLPIQLNAPFDGRFYLHLEAILETADGTSTRTLSIAVQVGEASTKALKPSIQSSQNAGEAVVSLPAQETIKP